MYKILRGGCYANHPAPFTMERPNGIPDYLLLFIHTRATFQIKESTFEVSPDQILIVDKQTPYRYSALENVYTDDWMHFKCPASESPALLPSMLNTPIALGNASRVSFYIQQVLWEFAYAPHEFKDKNVDMLMRILMNHIHEAARYQYNGQSYSPYYARLQEIRLQLQSNPSAEIDLDKLCRTLSVSPSYFQHLYTKLFGVSFRNDIISMRIHYAKELLAGTQYTIHIIALLSGYHNEVHFYRQFRALTGMTPAAYRKNAGTLP